MGVDQVKVKDELHVLRKRPTHGHLYATPPSRRGRHHPHAAPHGPELLEDIGIEGTRMRLPPSPPRSQNPPTSSFTAPGSLRGGGGSCAEGSWGDSTDTEESPQGQSYMNFINSPPMVKRSLHSTEESGRKKETTGQPAPRKAFSSPLYDSASARKSRAPRPCAPSTCSSSSGSGGGPSSQDGGPVPEQIDVPHAAWPEDAELSSLEGESLTELAAQVTNQGRLEDDALKESPLPPSSHRELLDELHAGEPLPVSKAARDGDERPLAHPETDVLDWLPEEKPPYPESGGSGTVDGIHPCDPAGPPRVVPDTPTRNLVLGATNIRIPAAAAAGAQNGATDKRPAAAASRAQAAAGSRVPLAPPKGGPTKERASRPAKPVPQRVLLQPKVPRQPKATPTKVAAQPSKPKAPPKDKTREPRLKNVSLPVSGPEQLAEAAVDDPASLAKEVVTATVHRAPVKKKEKVHTLSPGRRSPTPPQGSRPAPNFEHKGRGDLVYSDEDEEETERQNGEDSFHGSALTLDLPTLPSLEQVGAHPAGPRGRATGPRGALGAQLPAAGSKPRWGQKQRDTSLAEEEERERLAEERRRRIASRTEHHKGPKGGDWEGGDDDISGVDDYGFLEKYCILSAAAKEKYRYTFEHVDEGRKGSLTTEETACGLRALNPGLSTSERTYLFRVLEMTGHRLQNGTSLKLFCILAALSQRVAKLDEWARNMMNEFDYKNLERKLFLCRSLWECNVDEATRRITLEQLVVELRAGGVSPEHEAEVRHKLAGLRALDFLDFLLYVPLFVLIHQAVVSHPLSRLRQT